MGFLNLSTPLLLCHFFARPEQPVKVCRASLVASQPKETGTGQTPTSSTPQPGLWSGWTTVFHSMTSLLFSQESDQRSDHRRKWPAFWSSCKLTRTLVNAKTDQNNGQRAKWTELLSTPKVNSVLVSDQTDQHSCQTENRSAFLSNAKVIGTMVSRVSKLFSVHGPVMPPSDQSSGHWQSLTRTLVSTCYSL